MKTFLAILVLIISFQSFSKADDIRDFQIEGMSIGDSLLDYVNKDFINDNKSYLYKNKEYYTILLEQDYEVYDAVQITVEDNDKNHIIKSLTGKTFYRNNNISECYKLLDNIDLEISQTLKKIILEKKKTKIIPHSADETGESTTKGISYFLDNKDTIYVYCTDWSKKMGYWDNLKVQIKTKAYNDWLSNKAY